MRLLRSSLPALVLCLCAIRGQGKETITSSPEVCESKTINYITHTLPQQCLRTSWSTANSTDHNSVTTATGTASYETATETSTQTEEVVSRQTSTQVEASEKKKEDGPGEGKGVKEGEDDSEDLATSSFMSFEEWKAMMLQKSGQDPADLKGRKHQEGRDTPELGPNDGLDTWGDDGEIALDFNILSDKISGMTATASAKGGAASGDASNVEGQEPVVYDDDVAHYRRPRDAGKTCKERFSYSSFDGGATILKTSPGVKNSKAIQVENKDSYMLFICSQENKFVIVELSEDILVDTVVLANFEFFSSMIRKFRVSVSDKYPVKMEKWKDLGTFQARNSRDIQAFLIDNPKIWAKYIRIEFLSHYGNEYYCPVSLLRVHGTRMLDSWKDAEAGPDDDEPAETIMSPDAEPEQELPQEIPTAPEPEVTNAAEHEDPAAPNESSGDIGLSPWYTPLFNDSYLEVCGIGTPTIPETAQISPLVSAENDISPPDQTIPSTHEDVDTSTVGQSTVSSKVIPAPSTNIPWSTNEVLINTTTSSISDNPPLSTDATINKTQTIQHPVKSSMIPPKSVSAPKAGDSSSSKSSTKQPTHNNQDKASSSMTSAPAPSPTVQESFFKSISKRLQFLESNTTLSLQYIEDQSRFLQDALQKMERKQISRVDTFLDNLNNTVLSELHNVRQQYDQIWQSTVLALETQREQSQREIIALSSRLNLLADEVVFQKRMAIFQSVLLLCCLILVLFSRGVLGGSGDQWPMTATSQFINSYLGSPRWPPGSPRSASRGNTPKIQRLTSGGSTRRSGGGTLHPHDLQRSGSNTTSLNDRHGLAPLSHSMLYTDKTLPLTPTSEGFDSTNEDGSPTPPTKIQPPRICVDEPDEPDDLYEIEGVSQAHDEGDDYSDGINRSPEKIGLVVEDGPSSGEESSVSAVTLMDEREGSGSAEEEDELHAEDTYLTSSPSKPPLTRSPLSELGGNIRKPLPALPEDPIL